MKYEFKSIISTIRTFKDFFSLSSILKDIVLFPLEYCFGKGRTWCLPTSITLLLTHRCNLSCSICFDKNNRNIFKDDLSFSLINKLFISFPNKYRPAIFLGGGEPFIRNDIADILLLIKSNDLKVGIVSNGLFLSNDKIGDYPPDILMISFHGPRKEHESLVGLSGAFDTVLNNIKSYQERYKKTKIIFNYILNEYNFSKVKVETFINQCKEKNLEIKNVRLVHLNFLTKQEQDNQSIIWAKRLSDIRQPFCNVYNRESNNIIINNEEIDRILEYIQNNIDGISFVFKPYLTKQEIFKWYSNSFDLFMRKCFFPWRSIFVNTDAKVYACQNMQFSIGSINDEDIATIWSSRKLVRFRKELKKGLLPACSRCCKL